MAQIRQYHKDTDTTYVYESESYWDPEKKQSRSRRRVIGKIDPATGEIIPTGKRGRKPKEVPAVTAASADQEELKKQYEEKCRENKESWQSARRNCAACRKQMIGFYMH